MPARTFSEQFTFFLPLQCVQNSAAAGPVKAVANTATANALAAAMAALDAVIRLGFFQTFLVFIAPSADIDVS